jgi:hypothetical protein
MAKMAVKHFEGSLETNSKDHQTLLTHFHPILIMMKTKKSKFQ